MDSSAWPAPLAGQTILVAEEEALISFDIEASLHEAGANVVTVQDQRQGLLAAIGDRLTAAVLADKLGDDPIDPICDCLARRSIPFLFLAGDSDKHAKKWAPAPIRCASSSLAATRLTSTTRRASTASSLARNLDCRDRKVSSQS